MSRQIRTSAKTVIIKNGKLLAINLNYGKEEWYILPGGGQDGEGIKLRRSIMNFYEGKEYTKYLENEEIGDPECLE